MGEPMYSASVNVSKGHRFLKCSVICICKEEVPFSGKKLSMHGICPQRHPYVQVTALHDMSYMYRLQVHMICSTVPYCCVHDYISFYVTIHVLHTRYNARTDPSSLGAASHAT